MIKSSPYSISRDQINQFSFGFLFPVFFSFVSDL